MKNSSPSLPPYRWRRKCGDFCFILQHAIVYGVELFASSAKSTKILLGKVHLGLLEVLNNFSVCYFFLLSYCCVIVLFGNEIVSVKFSFESQTSTQACWGEVPAFYSSCIAQTLLRERSEPRLYFVLFSRILRP